jgi:phosphate acetyltransferase
MDILNLIESKAKSKKRKILLVEGEDERIIEAASLAVKNNIASPVLLGNKEKISKIAEKNKIPLEGIGVIEYENNPDINKFAEKQLT